MGEYTPSARGVEDGCGGKCRRNPEDFTTSVLTACPAFWAAPAAASSTISQRHVRDECRPRQRLPPAPGRGRSQPAVGPFVHAWCWIVSVFVWWDDGGWRRVWIEERQASGSSGARVKVKSTVKLVCKSSPAFLLWHRASHAGRTEGLEH